MKEATGELNMTVITVIAIAAVAALFYAFVWPMIQRTIVQQTCNAYGVDYNAVKGEGKVDKNGKTSKWFCCKGEATSGTDCIATEEDA